jgi:hypothetical protein
MKKKRILSLLIALTMVLSIMPMMTVNVGSAPAFAAGGWTVDTGTQVPVAIRLPGVAPDADAALNLWLPQGTASYAGISISVAVPATTPTVHVIAQSGAACATGCIPANPTATPPVPYDVHAADCFNWNATSITTSPAVIPATAISPTATYLNVIVTTYGTTGPTATVTLLSGTTPIVLSATDPGTGGGDNLEWVKVWGLDTGVLAVEEPNGPANTSGMRQVTVGGNRAGFRTESSNIDNFLTVTGNNVAHTISGTTDRNLTINTSGSNWSAQAGFRPTAGVRYRISFDVSTTATGTGNGVRVEVGRRASGSGATAVTAAIWARSATGTSNHTTIGATPTPFSFEFDWGVRQANTDPLTPPVEVGAAITDAAIMDASIVTIIPRARGGVTTYSNMRIEALMEPGSCTHADVTTVAATCTAAGTRTCNAADCTWTETIAALGHAWNVTTPATCTTAGVRACTRTGCTPAAADLVVPIDATAHTFEGAAPHCGKTCTQATCTHVHNCGVVTCTTCNACTVCANGATFNPATSCCATAAGCGRVNEACTVEDCPVCSTQGA